MDAYMPVIEHIQDHYVAYLCGVAAVAILSLVFRKYALPLEMKVLEIAGYVIAMHVVLATFVRVLSWFKGATAMRALSEKIDDVTPGFRTPYFEFWNRGEYNPEWLVYVELGFVAAITGLVLYFRPVVLATKKKRDRAVAQKPQKVAKYDRDGNRITPSAAAKAKAGGKKKGKRKR